MAKFKPKFLVSSSFGKPETIYANSHSGALGRYIDNIELHQQRSYPEEAWVSVTGKGVTRDYVCVDGFFERHA